MSGCGGGCGKGCSPCGDPCGKKECKQPCLRWGFDDCLLRARCADGTELDPLNLCDWLHSHETCTELRLVAVGTSGDSYMEYLNECGNSDKFYVCDFLGLAELGCLKDVEYINDGPHSCDMLVFDPCCGSACGEGQGKWVNYHIPDAGDCELQPDENGFYHVLVKDGCGCIKECKLFAQTRVWEWSLRDSWPDDPDWPFSMGSRMGDNSEIIDLELDKRCPMFGKTDLEVTFQYSYGVQNTAGDGLGLKNFKSIVTPMNYATHTPGVTDVLSKAIVTQLGNLFPYGSWETQTSRTVIVPKGQKLFLNHVIEVRLPDTTIDKTFYGESSAPTKDSSRLHELHVFVRAVQGEKK